MKKHIRKKLLKINQSAIVVLNKKWGFQPDDIVKCNNTRKGEVVIKKVRK